MNNNYTLINIKKKDEGCYFTPSFITEYICNKSLIYSLRKNKETNSIKNLLIEYNNDLYELSQKLKNLKILDPSCGNGAFLSKMFDKLVKLHNKIANLQNQNSKVNLRSKIIKNNLYGVDINKENIDYIKKLFLKQVNTKIIQENDLDQVFKVGNSIVNDYNVDTFSFDWKENFKDVFRQGGFDIIIGNPPWGANINKYKEYIKKEYKDISKGQFDSFSIFLYNSIRNLIKNDGIIGFIVPNELCLLELNKNLREYLLKFKILEIINMGFNIFQAVQKPALLIILKKVKINYENSKNNKTLISVGLNEKDKKNLAFKSLTLNKIVKKNSYLRNQEDFLKNTNYNFDIFSDTFDIKIKKIIKNNNFKPLKYYFYNGRGIDTNKEGNYIVCPKCNLLNPPFGRGHSSRIKVKRCKAESCNYIFKKNEESQYKSIKLISEKDFPVEDYNAPGYIGQDLYKLFFNRKPRAFKYYGDKIKKANINNRFKNLKEIKWGKNDLYHGDKLLIRKVSSDYNLQVMVHSGFLITNQQIYIFKKRDHIKNISIYYFLGILASRLIHYFYIKEFGDPDKEILPYFTQSNIKSLPLPIIDINDEIYKRIIFNIKFIIQFIIKYKSINKDEESIKETLIEKIQSYYNQLDNDIFTLYNIQDLNMKKEIIIRANNNGFKFI